MKRRFRHILLLGALFFGLGLGTYAQQMPLPVKDQMPLFLKILSYDKNLAQRGEEIVLGVFYQERYRASLLAKEEVLAVMQSFRTVSGRPIRTVPLALDAQHDLSARLGAAGANVIYVAPLRAFDLEQITAASQAHAALTLTGVPAYLAEGLSVSLDVKGGKPLILINLPTSEAEGANFHSQLLKFAQVVR